MKAIVILLAIFVPCISVAQDITERILGLNHTESKIDGNYDLYEAGHRSFYIYKDSSGLVQIVEPPTEHKGKYVVVK